MVNRLSSVQSGVPLSTHILNQVDNPVPILDTAPSPYLLKVGRGEIEGARIFNIPGRHDANVETTALGDISTIPNVVVLPSPGGAQLEIVSSSALDAAPSGDGVRSVNIHYLDTSFVEQMECVLTDGATPVNTVATDIQEVQWIHTKTIGDTANGVAVGNISLRSTDGVITYEYIEAGGNQSLSSRYTVPAAHTGYLLFWNYSAIKKRVDFYLRSTNMRFDRSLLPGVFLFQDFGMGEVSVSGALPLNFLEIPATATIKISGKADTAGGEAGASFSILVIAD